MPKVKKPLQLAIFIGFCLSAGALGSLFTVSAIPNWYVTLIKPTLSPPNWVFAPVWTTLYILMGISAYLVSQSKKIKSKNILTLFWVHLFFNATWSIVFFGLRNPFLGLINIVLLWLLIVIVIYKFWKINQLAGVILLPYLAWVSFATYLNFSILSLNP